MPNPSRPRAAALTAVALLLSSLVAGCGGDAKGDDLTEQKLSWEDCPEPSQAQGGGNAPSPLANGDAWRCATMKAPLDWGDPRGDTIDIALVRAGARGDERRRIGSLLFNFGGPGGSGVTRLPASGETYEALRTRYDLVSFDPRGVGRSAGVRCQDDQRLDAFFQQDLTPDDAAERTALLDSTKEFNEACEEHSGKVLPHVRTTDAARDLDLMRQVLGDDKLYYFGISYGTELGGVYAHLFPKKVGRAVFDAVVDPTRTPEQNALAQAKGFQLALDNYAEDCAARSEGCAVGATAQDVKNRIAALLDDLDARPVPGIYPRELTQGTAINGILQALYSKELWPILTEGLQQAYAGDGRILTLLSDSLNGRSQNGEYSNRTAANVAINCADEKPRYSVAHIQRRLPEFRAASALFGESLAWGMAACAGWAVPGAADHPDVSAPGAAPILVVGNTGDPATPYEGARAMVRALGSGVGVELTFKGQGHGAYSRENKCVRTAVNGYLLDGKVPAAGTVCS
ncbi:alpha/beta hydrolase [Streptomyces sp. A012304]|uniref:alpha/beta hydrolase n=1 Tax=Streptomyces sp. A012304 TaxID=375446 RepID=UPI00222E5CBE|nr:alpha/beta hydrolase [Streptomyces sp. A012304]GKQ34056.1 peptidase [Streptomyces sp. A012304]